MKPTTSLIVGLGAAIAAAAVAQQPGPPTANAARLAELEAQVTHLTLQLEHLRANRAPEVRWAAARPGPHAPASPLQRASAVASIEAGCPPGAVCLVVRCDAPHGR